MKTFLEKSLRSTKKWFTRDRKIAISIFLLALLIRTIYILIIGDRFILESGDQSHYRGIALNFYQGKGFMDGSSYRSPLYPFLMGLFFHIFGHTPLLFKLFQGILGSFIPVFLFYIGRNLFNRRVGGFAALFSMADPVLVHYTSQFLTETLFFVFLLGLLTLLSDSHFREKIKERKTLYVNLAVMGLLTGLGTLTRSVFISFPIVIGLWLIFALKMSLLNSLKNTALIIIFCFFTLSPWMARNVFVHGKFIPLTTNFGVNLWIGNNPEATGGYHIPASGIDESVLSMPEWERNNIFLSRAVSFILTNPSDFLRITLRKMILYWDPYPHTTTRLIFILLVPLSLMGIFLYWKRYPVSRILLFTIIYFYCTTVIFFTAHRFTILTLPFLILYASSAVSMITERKSKKVVGKSVCIVRHFYYPQDSHVVRNAKTLQEAGYDVEVICLRNRGEPGQERIDGIKVYRLPVRHKRGSLLHYFYEYSAFFILSGIVMSCRYFVKRYDVIEIDNLPDFLVFSTAIPKLFGAKIVLYMFEPMLEIFQSEINGIKKSLLMKFVAFLERTSTRYADTVITFTDAFYQVQIRRGLPPSKGTYIYSVPDDRSLNTGVYPSLVKMKENGFKLLYHGSILKRYGIKDLIHAMNLLQERIPELHLEVIGQGEYLKSLNSLVNDMGMKDRIHFKGFLPFRQIPVAIASADVGIVPLVLNEHTNLTIPTKLFEYVAMKRPVIATRTQAMEKIFDENCIMYYESSNVDQLADCILELYQSPQKRQRLTDNAYARYEEIKWSVSREKYCSLINPAP
jgi:glycosyltransferase involved in cell wall biosynthesis